MLISIIIRSYNEERHIGRLLKGIGQQTRRPDIEVILVDSGSTDETVKIAKAHGTKIVHISPEEFSFGRALNRGCEVAAGDILLFASAHVYPVYNNWVDKMADPFHNPSVALVYGRQVGNEVTKFSEQQLFKKWFPSESNYNQSHPFCNNANCAIRKSLWMEQPFDEAVTGLEDLEWAGKIMEKGYKVCYEAGAVIVHVHDESYSKIKNRYRREAITLKKLYPKVSFSLWDFTRLFVSNTLSDMYHAAEKRVFLHEVKGILAFRLMQFWGTYLGHLQKGDVNGALKNRFYYANSLRSGKKDESASGEDNVIDYNYI
jgi:rhamnosyltransferase